MAQTKQLLDYLASQEEAVLTYRASDMILAVHSDAGYLNEPSVSQKFLLISKCLLQKTVSTD